MRLQATVVFEADEAVEHPRTAALRLVAFSGDPVVKQWGPWIFTGTTPDPFEVHLLGGLCDTSERWTEDDLSNAGELLLLSVRGLPMPEGIRAVSAAVEVYSE